jgi:hypothetical protein
MGIQNTVFWNVAPCNLIELTSVIGLLSACIIIAVM